MIGGLDGGIGHDLAGNGKFMIRQGGDERFTRRDGVQAFKLQNQRVARTGKGDAGPGLLAVGEDFSLILRQRSG